MSLSTHTHILHACRHIRTNTGDLWDWRFFSGCCCTWEHHTHTQETAKQRVRSASKCRRGSYWNVSDRLVCSMHTQSCVVLNVTEENLTLIPTVGCVYIRWDWETTLARLRPLLSTTEVLAPPTLPELCLLVRTRPRWWGKEEGGKGRRRRERGETESLMHMNYFFVFTPTLEKDAGGKSGETEWRRPGWGKEPLWRHTGGKHINLGPLVLPNTVKSGV